MIERIKVTVRPSTSHADLLTVPDAMRQVLDIFELLSNDNDGNIVWALVGATMNSPLTIEGEAIGKNPSVDVRMAARADKARFTRGIRALRGGSIPMVWRAHEKVRTARRLMQRTTRGVGQTEVTLSENAPIIVITPDEATAALRLLDRAVETHELLDEDRSRDEYGSIEGTLLLAGFEYNQPAIQVLERRTGREVWCRVTQEQRDVIAESTNFRDVWDHRRVTVRGRIRYGKDGGIVRVYANSVTRNETKTVTVEELRDPRFTGGLSVRQYLDLFREGEARAIIVATQRHPESLR